MESEFVPNKISTKTNEKRGSNLENFKKSLISFDKGGSWHPLKAPSK